MNRQSRRVLYKAIRTHIVNIEIVSTQDIKQLVLDVVNKKQKLYSIVIAMAPLYSASTNVIRNKTSRITTLENFMGLFIEDICVDEDYVLIYTDNISLYFNMTDHKFYRLTSDKAYALYHNILVRKNGL